MFADTILQSFRLDGQVAVVTGAGRGIGAATATALAQAGADVVISARSKDELAKVAGEIELAGRRALTVPADLSDLDEAAGLVQVAVDAFGRLDIVVNNVGSADIKSFLDTSWADLQAAFAFNVGIAHTLTRAAVPYLLDRGGSVVNITSTVGRVGARGWLAYGTAKGGLAQYTRLAARDLAPRIRVNAVTPGAVATSVLEDVLSDDRLRAQLESLTPMRRVGVAEEIAAAVLYLASPAAAYVTGKVFEIDGGIDTPNVDFGMPDL
ncbi:SDR family oxidoreductase [Nonomuraea sp. NPDC003804]|uniref:SDR family oxidoreductase n=1 Tax=Nonomuraea sp. NPDC003804 TaxID=3154547 RepID=UPI0033A19DB7